MANQSEPKGSTGIAAIVAIIIVLIISLGCILPTHDVTGSEGFLR